MIETNAIKTINLSHNPLRHHGDARKHRICVSLVHDSPSLHWSSKIKLTLIKNLITKNRKEDANRCGRAKIREIKTNIAVPTENPWFGEFDGAPIYGASDQWTLDFVSTPFGLRQALRNVTTISISGFPSADIVVSSWIDVETGLLLLLTEELSANGLQSRNVGLSGISTNSTQSTSIELVACNFLGIPGYLLWTKISGVSLLSVLVVSGVLIMACLAMVKVSHSVLSKPKREHTNYGERDE